MFNLHALGHIGNFATFQYYTAELDLGRQVRADERFVARDDKAKAFVAPAARPDWA